jgi:D-alanyl-D-alanine carboxypeptidase (penicillin-binding protein 5/6)
MAPSSMTKLMTAFLVFEALEDGQVRPDTVVTVSRGAAAVKGASLGLDRGAKVAVRDLLAAMIVHSANDAAVALAEEVGRSHGRFASLMTRRARLLDLRRTRFVNATGHSARSHYSTAADLATLAALIIAKFPKRYDLFSKKNFSFGGKTYQNRNPLLGTVAGVDGLKTGQTRAGGYGLVTSAQREGRRLIVVVNGLDSETERAKAATALLEWGFSRLAADASR